jgi:hypothetical protein
MPQYKPRGHGNRSDEGKVMLHLWKSSLTKNYSKRNEGHQQVQNVLMIFIEQDLIPKKDKGAYNHF